MAMCFEFSGEQVGHRTAIPLRFIAAAELGRLAHLDQACETVTNS